VVRLLQWQRGEAETAPALPERLEVLGQVEWDSFLQAPVLEVVATRPLAAQREAIESEAGAAAVGAAALES
jgi:hypothetical protein